MKKIVRYLLLLPCLLAAQKLDQVILDPIILPVGRADLEIQRSVYSIDTRFNASDTLLFLRKTVGMRLSRVDSLSQHELLCTFYIDSGFIDLGDHELVVLDALSAKKLSVKVQVRTSQLPQVRSVRLQQAGRSALDTLVLPTSGKTLAMLTLVGSGFYASTDIQFDGQGIKVLNSASWRTDFPPDSLRIGLEIGDANLELGARSFRICNPYGAEGYGTLVLVSERPPMAVGALPSVVADGAEKKIKLAGWNFYKGLQVELLPPDGRAGAEVLSAGLLEVSLQLPVLDNDRSYRLILRNQDGQTDTTGYFTAQTMPLSGARVRFIEGAHLFTERKTRMVLAVDTNGLRRLDRKKSYEISVEGERFPVTQILDDSTCEALITIKENPAKVLMNQHVFTLGQVGAGPRWKGVLKSRPSPKVYYISPYRILHPLDTLNLVIKGRDLENVQLTVDEPEISFKILENRDDLVHAYVYCSRQAGFGSYPLELRVDNVPFRLEQHQLEVKPWQEIPEFLTLVVGSLGDIPAAQTWRGQGHVRQVEPNDAIQIKINSEKIRTELGTQKFEITAALLDSSNTVRSESNERRFYALSDQDPGLYWRWRPRTRGRSGDRIEITVRNPGEQNKLTEVLVLKRHWYESFHGSTSFIIVKIPFDSGQATTEILQSAAIGLTYQPTWSLRFLAFDMAFIIGNFNSSDNSSVSTGLGLSAIFWNHLQFGVGVSMTGDVDQKGFGFIGSRFKIPIPWR